MLHKLGKRLGKRLLSAKVKSKKVMNYSIEGGLSNPVTSPLHTYDKYIMPSPTSYLAIPCRPPVFYLVTADWYLCIQK